VRDQVEWLQLQLTSAVVPRPVALLWWGADRDRANRHSVSKIMIVIVLVVMIIEMMVVEMRSDNDDHDDYSG